MGWKPSDDPDADELRNKNLNKADQIVNEPKQNQNENKEKEGKDAKV
jgi:hypothetical protein